MGGGALCDVLLCTYELWWSVYYLQPTRLRRLTHMLILHTSLVTS